MEREYDLRQEERKRAFKRAQMGSLSAGRADYAQRLRKETRDRTISQKRLNCVLAENSSENMAELAAVVAFVQSEPLLMDDKASFVNLTF